MLSYEGIYNYIFFSLNEDYFDPYFNELGKYDNVCLRELGIDSKSKLVKLLFRAHWSAKINRRMKLPFRRLWYKAMCNHAFNYRRPTCYVFLGGQYARQDNGAIMDYIKRTNPDNKIVLYYLDLFKQLGELAMLTHKADLLISYDKQDSEKNGFRYVPCDAYSPLIEVTERDSFEWDVYFLGYAKDRLDTIHKAWRRFSEAGLRCRFLVAGTKPERRISGEGLHYIDKPIPYRQSLEDIAASRCVLELIQGSSVATTMRALEAVTYKRKLISNCPVLADSPLYCPQNMLCFTHTEDIDTGFAKSPIDYEAYRAVKTESPDEYLKKLELLLREGKSHVH